MNPSLATLRAATFAALTALSLSSTSALASTINYRTSITFNSTGEPDEGMVDPAAISPGDRFILDFSLDGSFVDTDGGTGIYGPQASFGGAATMSMTRDSANIGTFDPSTINFGPSYTFKINSGASGVVIDFMPVSPEIPYSSIFFGDSVFEWSRILIQFSVPNADTGSGQALSTLIPDHSAWTNFNVSIMYYFHGIDFILEQPTTGSLEVIPEPSTYGLVAMGAAAGWWARRRHRRTA